MFGFIRAPASRSIAARVRDIGDSEGAAQGRPSPELASRRYCTPGIRRLQDVRYILGGCLSALRKNEIGKLKISSEVFLFSYGDA